MAVTNPRDGQSALHIASAYDYAEVVARVLREGGEMDLKDRRGITALEYARGSLTRFVLARFKGRDPKLDAVVRSNPAGDFAKLFAEVQNVPDRTRGIYIKYAGYRDAGTLAARAATFAERLKKDSARKEDRDADMQRFAIARFLLAGSDAPMAVEAMMQR